MRTSIGVGAAVLLFGSLASRAHADTYQFTNGAADGLYKNGADWTDTTTGTTGTVPDLTTANSAQINDGVNVDYVAGPDLHIGGGGTLEITNGGFVQTGGNNWIQLDTNGTVNVDGGTFDQGTDSNSPFAVNGTGDVFNVTNGGTAILTNGFEVKTGLSSTFDSGNATITGQIQVSATLTIAGASNISTTNGIQVNSGGTMTFSGGTITNSGGGITVNGTYTMSGGTTSTISGQSVGINSGGIATISGGSLTSGNELDNSGTLMITGGTVITNGSVVNNGTFSMSGGALTLNAREFDYNTANSTLSGGTITTPLITGVNGGAASKLFTISGGTLALSGPGYGGIYSGGSAGNGIISFTATSTGYIDFTNGDTLATVQGFINGNQIEYNNMAYDPSTNYSNFVFGTDSNGFVTLTDAFGMAAVPEPATWLAGAMLAFAAVPVVRRQFARQTA